MQQKSMERDWVGWSSINSVGSGCVGNIKTISHLKNVFWPPAFGGIGASLARVADVPFDIL